MEALESAINIKANTIFGIERGLFRLGKDLITSFKSEIKKTKSGKLYRSGGRRIRASAPGQSPATRTGNYRRSVGYKISGNTMRFGNSADYAGFLETGTSRMKPRPGLGNAIKANERNALRSLASAVSEAV